MALETFGTTDAWHKCGFASVAVVSSTHCTQAWTQTATSSSRAFNLQTPMVNLPTLPLEVLRRFHPKRSLKFPCASTDRFHAFPPTALRKSSCLPAGATVQRSPQLRCRRFRPPPLLQFRCRLFPPKRSLGYPANASSQALQVNLPTPKRDASHKCRLASISSAPRAFGVCFSSKP